MHRALRFENGGELYLVGTGNETDDVTIYVSLKWSLPNCSQVVEFH